MKKYLLVFLLALICFAGFPQRFEVLSNDPAVPFKRHFSYSIEPGIVNGEPRQVVAGNQTDWLINNRDIKGNAWNSPTILGGRDVQLSNHKENILLTDFVISSEGENSQYAAGTGIYFPNGPTGQGFVFLGIYERGTMQLNTLVYFDLIYQNGTSDKD